MGIEFLCIAWYLLKGDNFVGDDNFIGGDKFLMANNLSIAWDLFKDDNFIGGDKFLSLGYFFYRKYLCQEYYL